MPSPFPGMDPYLEDPAIWPGVLLGFLTGIQDQLYHRLRPRYAVRYAVRYAGREQRVDAGDPAYPRAVGRWGSRLSAEPLDVEWVDRWMEIRRPGRTLVTAIELLTPAGKVEGSAARVGSPSTCSAAVPE